MFGALPQHCEMNDSREVLIAERLEYGFRSIGLLKNGRTNHGVSQGQKALRAIIIGERRTYEFSLLLFNTLRFHINQIHDANGLVTPLSEDIGTLCAGLAATADAIDERGNLIEINSQQGLEKLLSRFQTF